MKKKHILIVLFFIVLGYFSGKYHIVGETYYSLLHEINQQKNETEYSLPKNLTIDNFNITIAEDEFDQIKKKRNEALDNKYLICSSKDYVNAIFQTDSIKANVKLRLKGDLLDHIKGEKWSYRIKMPENEYFKGMSKFSIQAPETRNFLNEWFAMKVMEEEDILTLKYDFAQIQMNNNSSKFYAVEEAFSSSFLKRNQLRKSVIIKFSEDLIYAEQAYYNNYEEFQERAFHVSNIDAFEMSGILLDNELRSLFLQAKSLLENFRMGKLRTSEVFDLDKMSKFYALASVLGAEHGLVWHNLRFYFNPNRQRLEPIAFDLCAGEINKDLISNNPVLGYGWHNYDSEKSFYRLLFSDTLFQKKYNELVYRHSTGTIVEDIYKENKSQIDFFSHYLHEEYSYYKFPIGTFYNNQKMIEKLFNPLHSLNAYIDTIGNSNVILTIGNIHCLPVEILYAEINSEKYIPKDKIILSSKRRTETVEYKEFEFVKGLKSEESMQNRLFYKIFGLEKQFSEEINPYQFILKTSTSSSSSGNNLIN